MILAPDHPAAVIAHRAELLAEYAHGRSVGLLEVRDLMLQDPAADTTRQARKASATATIRRVFRAGGRGGHSAGGPVGRLLPAVTRAS